MNRRGCDVGAGPAHKLSHFQYSLYKMAILNAMASLQTGSYAEKHANYETHDHHYICTHVVEL